MFPFQFFPKPGIIFEWEVEDKLPLMIGFVVSVILALVSVLMFFLAPIHPSPPFGIFEWSVLKHAVGAGFFTFLAYVFSSERITW